MLEYLAQAFSAWFVGFFPLAEIYVAIPAAIALGLDDFSVIFWGVLGNFTPALLVNFLYEQLIRIERVNKWMRRMISEQAEERINRWGFWFVLLATPWTGIWIMAVTAKALKMERSRFLIAAFISILVYAIAILLTIRFGMDVFS